MRCAWHSGAHRPGEGWYSNEIQEEFEVFRMELFRDGIELKEIERVPYCVPETVL